MIEQYQLIDHAEIGRRAVSLASLNEQPRSVPLLVALAGTPGIPELVCREDVMLAELGAIVGVQIPSDDAKLSGPMTMAFLMKSKYVETVVTPDELPYAGMAFSIEPHTVELSKPKRPREWRRMIVTHLIEHAESDPLWTDRAGEIDATIERLKKNNPDSSIAVSSNGIMLAYEDSLKSHELLWLLEPDRTAAGNLRRQSILPFNLQRKMLAIAKVTRRGMGNRLIGSRSAVEDLLTHIPESQQSRLKIIIYEDGEMQKEPWLLVGYNGSNKYDTGLAFVYRNGRGALVDNDVKRYWRRLI